MCTSGPIWRTQHWVYVSSPVGPKQMTKTNTAHIPKKQHGGGECSLWLTIKHKIPLTCRPLGLIHCKPRHRFSMWSFPHSPAYLRCFLSKFSSRYEKALQSINHLPQNEPRWAINAFCRRNINQLCNYLKNLKNNSQSLWAWALASFQL